MAPDHPPSSPLFIIDIQNTLTLLAFDLPLTVAAVREATGRDRARNHHARSTEDHSSASTCSTIIPISGQKHKGNSLTSSSSKLFHPHLAVCVWARVWPRRAWTSKTFSLHCQWVDARSHFVFVIRQRLLRRCHQHRHHRMMFFDGRIEFYFSPFFRIFYCREKRKNFAKIFANKL